MKPSTIRHFYLRLRLNNRPIPHGVQSYKKLTLFGFIFYTWNLVNIWIKYKYTMCRLNSTNCDHFFFLTAKPENGHWIARYLYPWCSEVNLYFYLFKYSRHILFEKHVLLIFVGNAINRDTIKRAQEHRSIPSTRNTSFMNSESTIYFYL